MDGGGRCRTCSSALSRGIRNRGFSVCTAVAYRINADGTTSDFALVDAWTGNPDPRSNWQEAFSKASVVALAQWKFQPRPDVATARPTVTVATMTFVGKQGEDTADLRARCAIEDLATTLIELKNKGLPDDLNYTQFDREMRERRAGALTLMQRARERSMPVSSR